MGFHVEPGSATRTPVFWFNHAGILSWCGKEVSDLTKNDAFNMRHFVESMSYQDGYFHSESAPWNPFDERLLFGEPFRLWNIGRTQGKADRDAAMVFTGTIPKILIKDEFNLQTNVLKNLSDLADLAEKSYAEIAPTSARKSLLRVLYQVLSAWYVGGMHAAVTHFSNQPELILIAKEAA